MAFNILIVDDSEIMRKVIRRIINLSGFELGDVYEAEHGEEALKLLNENWVDVVISDINMPVMNGIELLKTIKKNKSILDTPVIFVSTEGRSENQGHFSVLRRQCLTSDLRCVCFSHVICPSFGRTR